MSPGHTWAQGTLIPSGIHIPTHAMLKAKHCHLNTQVTFPDADMPSLTLEANSVIQEAPSRNSAPLYWSDSGRCLLGPALNVVWSRTKIMVL